MASAESAIHRRYETGHWPASNSGCTDTRGNGLGSYKSGLWPENSPRNEPSPKSKVINAVTSHGFHLLRLAPFPATLQPKGRARTLEVASEPVGTAEELGIDLPVRIITEPDTPSQSLYLRLPGFSHSEAFALGLVVATCAAAIVYGFCCGINLTQSWELFSAGIQSLIR